MEVSWNRGTPKSSILIGFFSIINHPLGVPPFMDTPIYIYQYILLLFIIIIINILNIIIIIINIYIYIYT